MFDTEFEHATPINNKRSRSRAKGQGHNVKTSYDRQIVHMRSTKLLLLLLLLLLLVVAVGSIYSTLWSQDQTARYEIGQNSPERLARCSAAFKLQWILNCYIF